VLLVSVAHPMPYEFETCGLFLDCRRLGRGMSRRHGPTAAALASPAFAAVMAIFWPLILGASTLLSH